MPMLAKEDKQALWLEARDLDDFNRTKDNWQRQGWLLSADYHDSMYSAIAMKDSRTIVMIFKEQKVEPQENITPELNIATT